MKQLGQSAVGTGAGTLIYTVPTGYKTDVVDILLANTTAAAVTVSVHLVPSGGTAAAGNAMFSSLSIPANTTTHWSGIQSLTTGKFIQAIGGATGITMTVTGDEVRVGT